eukprot:389419_1
MRNNDESVCIEHQFDVTSSRVKALSFHTTEPLILSALHTPSAIQLWNYETGQLMHEFISPHDGAVRAIEFNPNTIHNEFISGGDDSIIRIWNYKTFNRLHELNGHLDYIRVIKYCPISYNKPWFISCSDDQTIRIWDYNLLTTITVITGATHYVMDIDWHINNKNLICSCSLDENIRIYDISKLNDLYENDHEQYISIFSKNISHNNKKQWFSKLSSNILFSNKYENKLNCDCMHSRGINTIKFHPYRNLIVTGGDDFNIGLGVYTNDNINILNVFSGHSNNVSSVEFIYDPILKCDMIISIGEDANIFIWQCKNYKYKNSLYWNFHRDDMSRYWTLTNHSMKNLFAVGHDRGFFIFKIIRQKYINLNYNIFDINDSEYEVCIAQMAQNDIDINIQWNDTEDEYTDSDESINNILINKQINVKYKCKCKINERFCINIIFVISLIIMFQIIIFGGG